MVVPANHFARAVRKGLPPIPARMQKLALDERGYPVPYFVKWIDGEPDFRVSDTEKWDKCIQHGHCWVCGEIVGKFKTFVIGPMCAVNRVTSEPPCHLDCAVFSATACPFLTLPKAQRNDANLPDHRSPGGFLLLRNPGACCLWTTLSYRVLNVGNGYLIRIGEPLHVRWYAEKEPATREQVLASIDSGMPLLRMAADKDFDSKRSHADLDEQYAAMTRWLPESPTTVSGDA